MKKQSPRAGSSSGSTPIPVRHQFDHVVPTVIHHPEEQMTALGRLVHHVLQDPRKFSTWALSLALGMLAVVVIWNLTTGRQIQSSEAWTKLEAAKKAEERLDVAKDFPNSPAASWALLQAADEYYNLALADLPNNRDVALPLFKKALDLFDRVASEAPKDSFQACAAALGKARSLEARGELGKAIDQYELVAKNKNWLGTPEADQAKLIAQALQKPEAAGFYKELYAYSPTKVTLPALDKEVLDLPSTGVNPPGDRMTPPPPPTPAVRIPLELAPPTVEEKRKLEKLEGPAAAKPSSPPAKTDSAQNPAAKTELPVEVFSPRADAPTEKAAPR
jgi:tetratricopeptide (TPR) repeat protein